MTIKDLLNTGMIGAYELINLFDIREDGYIFDDPKRAYEMPHLFESLEVLRISAQQDDIETPMLVIDIDKKQLSIADLLAQEGYLYE